MDYVGILALLLAIGLFCWGMFSLGTKKKLIKRPWEKDVDVNDDYWDDAAKNAGSM